MASEWTIHGMLRDENKLMQIKSRPVMGGGCDAVERGYIITYLDMLSERRHLKQERWKKI